MKRRINAIEAFGSVLVLLVPLFSGCFQTTEADSKHIQIPAILPLTGPAAVLGEFNKNGMEIAVEDANAELKTAGRQVHVEYGDSKNDAKEALSLFQQYTAVAGRPAVVCAMSSVTNALLQPTDDNGTALMATTVSAAGITAGHNRVFRLFIRADIDARTMAEFAAKRLGYKKVAILFVQDDMGASFRDVFKQYFEANGGRIIAEEGFDRAAIDFRPVLTRLKGQKCEAVYLLAYENTMGLIPKQMAELGMSTTILSIATIAQPYVIEQAGNSLNGAYFTSVEFDPDNPRTDKARQFIGKYTARFGKKPNYFSAFAYDTIMVLVEAVKTSGYTPEGIAAGLRKLHEYQGAIGKITFEANGDASFPMYVRKIQNGTIIDAEKKQ